MPIRTNRGRAAVYRRLWGWPLRSPRHLVGAIVGLIIIAVAVTIGISHLRPPTPSTTSANSGGISSGPTAPATSPAVAPAPASGIQPTTRLASPPETPSSAPPAPQALLVVQEWGQAWVNHPVGMANQAWLAQLQPYTEPEFLPQLASVNLANIPATQVTGPATAITSYTSSVVALLPTNGGNLQITVVSTPQGWQVSAYTDAS
jgi:hypothetical protein